MSYLFGPPPAPVEVLSDGAQTLIATLEAFTVARQADRRADAALTDLAGTLLVAITVAPLDPARLRRLTDTVRTAVATAEATALEVGDARRAAYQALNTLARAGSRVAHATPGVRYPDLAATWRTRP